MRKGAGSRIGAYEIVTLLGAGGMGEVYRARDSRLGREVALKLLPESYALDRERRARFEREAQILASLNHPHIATIYGFEDSGTPALVMELVEGPTLADRIVQGPVSVREALEIGRQLILALDAAHERGIVHRDLKPANIKLGPDRAIKVLDFGLAKAVADEVSPATDLANSPTLSVVGTMAGVILGTAAYMSPEQARGQTVDKRTDIWAFGCVMFELLTGRKAFSGSTVSDVIAAILTQEPQWADLPPDVPQSTRDLLRRCLEKDPKNRLRDIGDAPLQTSLPPVVRSRAMVTIGAAVIAALFGAAIGSFFTRARTVPNAGLSSNTVATRPTDYGGSESAPAISPDGRAFVFISDHDGTPDLWLRQIAGGELVRLTNDAEPEAEPVYAPDGESVYFSRSDADGFGIWQTGVLGGRPRRIVTGGRGPAPSPDGRQLAFLVADASNSLALALRAVDSAEHRVLVRSLPGGVTAPSWSRDGKQLSFVRGGLFAATNLFVIDVATGSVRQVTNYTRGLEGVSAHKWLPDNQHIVVSYVPFPRQLPAADIGILNVEDGSIARLTTTVQRGLTALTVSADGTRLLAVSTENAREVWRIPADPRERPLRLFGPRGDPMWTFLTQDGRLLLFNGTVSGSRNLWLGPVENLGDARQVTFLQGDTIAHSSLSPDGSRVAFVSTATGNSDVWVQNVDGSDLRQLTNDVAADSWPVFSPDGKALVYTSLRGTQQETWTVPSTGGTAERLFDGFFRGDWQPQPAGSGTWIVTSNGQDRVRLLDVERRAVVWDVRVANSGLSLPMFNPDRRSFSMPFQAGRDRDTIGIFDTATGNRRTAIEMPFRVFFRANWTGQGSAFIVNRNASPSHIVLFDRFWSPR